MSRSEPGAHVRRVLVLVVLVLVVLAAVLGAAWALLSPSLPVGILRDGSATPLDPEARSRFDAAVVFALGSLVVGLLAGGMSWFVLRRHRGVPLLLTVVLGSLLAAIVAELVGLGVGHLRYSGRVAAAATGSTTESAPELGSWAFVLVQPFGAALAHTVLLAFTHDDDLGPAAADRRVGPVPAGADAHGSAPAA
jgi:hypothetical protein